MADNLTNATIVLLGKFNPDDFRIERLSKERVISDSDTANGSYVALAGGSVTHFKIPWAEVLVTEDRIQVTTSEVPYVRICDFVEKAMREVARVPEVKAFGINYECHIDLGTMQARDALGTKLAPPQAWGKWGGQIGESMNGEPELHGGMMLLRMRKPFRSDGVSGWLDIAVAPSSRIPGNRGVAFRTNHHHALNGDEGDAKANQADGGRILLGVLAKTFDSSIENAEAIIQETLAQ